MFRASLLVIVLSTTDRHKSFVSNTPCRKWQARNIRHLPPDMDSVAAVVPNGQEELVEDPGVAAGEPPQGAGRVQGVAAGGAAGHRKSVSMTTKFSPFVHWLPPFPNSIKY